MILGLLIVMSPMLLLVAFILKGESKRQRARADAWGREIAEAVGGRYVPVADLDNPWVTFAIGGRAAEFTFNWSETPRTTVDIAVSGLSPGALSVHAQAPEFLRRLLRIRAVEIGEYAVQAQPESLAGRIFSEERRGRLLGRLRALEAFGPPVVELTRDVLSVGVQARVKDVGTLRAIVKCAEPFLDALREQPEGAAWQGGGRCPVCASELAEDVLTCPACRTPHHADCWRYVGRCSVYACRGRV